MLEPVTMKRCAQLRAQRSRAPTPKEGKPSPSKRRSLTGGILTNKTKKYTSYVVNKRPQKWNDDFKPSQFWFGKLRSFERAQLVADAVCFYVGEPPFHFKDVVNQYPPITCMGRVPGTPEELSTQEMFRSYISAIAKGVEFEPQRKDFIAQVKAVIEMDTFPFPAPLEDDVAHDEEEEDTSAIEDDENAAMAIRMSSNHVPGSDPAHEVLVSSFELQHTGLGSHLYSVGQCSTSQLMPFTESIDDCPTFQDEEGDQEWKQWMNDLIDQTAAGASTPSVVSDDEDHHQEP